MRVRVNARREAEERFAALTADPPWAVRPAAKRQLRVLEHLLDNGPQSLFSLKCALGDWAPEVAAKLEGAGLLTLGELKADMVDSVDQGACAGSEPLEREPTGEQQAALAEMAATLDNGGGAHLVHGVTGSGKTLLYLEMAAACLERGRSVLLLAPEVALACKLYRNAAERFPGAKVVLYHGYQSPTKRAATFAGLAGNGEPLIVVGTRSSLFLPVPDLGMIVLDEEHDESFKQEERLAYHAKEVAWFRAERNRALLVLAVGHAGREDLFCGQERGHPCLQPDRAGGGERPARGFPGGHLRADRVPNSSLRPGPWRPSPGPWPRGGQVIVMLNRRGYAPLMYCLDCGETVRCPDCEVGMTYHKGRERVICHYCGLSYPYPMLCAKCGGGNFVPMGEGTERLEEHLEAALPEGTRVLRLDRDATRRQERMEEILSDFGRGEAQVLVGTQMISKGHHFPNVTLVVVADGDLGLNLPDYRSGERTFQLLVQVAGRAGRGDAPGRVLIQTRNLGHPIWKEVLAGDYAGFYEREIGRRKLFGYPPFTRLALVRISYPLKYQDGPAAISLFARTLKERAGELGISVLGPAPAPLSVLRGRRRFNCLLKGDDWMRLRTLFAHLVRANPDPRQVTLALDLDPLTTL